MGSPRLQKGGRAIDGMIDGAADINVGSLALSEISMRASPTSRKRAFGSFFKQRRSRSWRRPDVVAGNALQSGSRSITLAMTSARSFPRQTRVGRSTSRTAHSRTPRCPRACRRLAPRLFRRHVRRGPEQHADASHQRGRRDCGRVGDSAADACRLQRPVPAPSRVRSPAPSPCRRRGP